MVEAQKNHEDHKDEGHRSALRPSKSDLSSNFDEEDQRMMNWSVLVRPSVVHLLFLSCSIVLGE